MIEENNKVIATWIGGVPCDRCDDCGMLKFGENDYRALEYLRYHNDWNLLMPACIKFCNLEEFETITDGKYHNRNPHYAQRVEDLMNTVKSMDIDMVYFQLINCINWYNQQTT